MKTKSGKSLKKKSGKVSIKKKSLLSSFKADKKRSAQKKHKKSGSPVSFNKASFRGAVSPYAKRKMDHIKLALDSENSAREGNGFDLVRLQHCALPEMDFHEVDISGKVFSRDMKTPFMVSGMTGGWPGAYEMNRIMAEHCEKRGWIMGTGSQRHQLTNPSSNREWIKIKKEHPELVLLGNIGLSQLIDTPLKEVFELVYSIEALGLVVHCNSLQEALQVEGTPHFKGGLSALKNLCKRADFPVIVKETGCGFSGDDLKALCSIGLYAVDVSGYGGTHWGRIEGARIKDKKNSAFLASQTFKHWGNSTLESLLWAGKLKNRGYRVWASGGIRDGLSACKGLCLGADVIGFAKPVMEALLQKRLDQFMEQMELELRIALFCTGRTNLKELHAHPPVGGIQ